MEKGKHLHYLKMAVAESRKGMDLEHGGPFGCIIVHNNQVIAAAHNNVLRNNDPTAHAEVEAIRQACSYLKTFQLTGCTVYCSCEPCPMCFGALYWARPDRVFFANGKGDAAAIGFDDAFIYEELALDMASRKIPFAQITFPEALEPFAAWTEKMDKKLY